MHSIFSFYFVVVFLLAFVFFFRQREEKKIKKDSTFRTKPSKMITIILLGLAFAVLCFDIIFSIATFGNLSNFIICTLLFSSVFLLLVFCYAWLLLNFVILDIDGVHVFRIFRKKTFYKYTEIKYLLDSSFERAYKNSRIECGIICYDKDKKKLFSISSLQVGVSIAKQRFIEHGTMKINFSFKN